MTRPEPRTFVVGAGLSGLAAAWHLARSGRSVDVFDAAGAAGGRCRSFQDAKLGCLIDNGNHLMFSGNRAAQRYITSLQAGEHFIKADKATFPFVDLATDRRFCVAMNDGPIPFWMLDPRRRVPGASFFQHVLIGRLLLAGPRQTVAEVIRDRGALWRGFVEPLTLAALNTVPERASARLLARVLRETFLKGGAFCRPMIARKGLGPALIEPALHALAKLGVETHLNRPLRQIDWAHGRAKRLVFAEDLAIDLKSDDRVILALPPAPLKRLLPPKVASHLPQEHSAILNVHFRTDPDLTDGKPPFLGVLGGSTHWIFTRPGLISLTISGADELGLLTKADDELVADLWQEVVAALGLAADATYAAHRRLTEKRATILQSPQNNQKRAASATIWPNLWLAGDATDTGLPATIEGAIRSGEQAARNSLQEYFQ